MTKTTTGLMHSVPLAEVLAWPKLNPRKSFAMPALLELADSIRKDGLLQPVSVAPAGLKKGGVLYWLFAGERRLRACALAGLKTIDVIVHDIDEATAHRLAGIENLERNDLTAIEEAIWLARELELTGKSQKELGEELGRSQSWIANRIRLLDLPKPIQTMIHNGTVAPAMARDTLLRFLKLNKADQAKLWKKITAAIKSEAKSESPVQLAALQDAVYQAVRATGAVLIGAGYTYDMKSNASFTVSASVFKAFKDEHGSRCFSAESNHYSAKGAEYTLALEAWAAVCAKALAESSSRSSTGGVPKKQLEDPKLSPTDEPVDEHELRRKYGRDNVIAFDQIVDPSQIDPTHVARTTNHGKEQLVYVGSNVRALKGSRTRAKTPVRAEVAEKVQAGRMDEGAELKTSQVLAGLLEAIVGTNYTSTLQGMIESELGRAIELNRYSVGVAQIADLKIPAKSLKRIAAGIAHVAAGKAHYWDLDGRIERAVETRVSKDSAKARKTWLAKHAPKVSILKKKEVSK